MEKKSHHRLLKIKSVPSAEPPSEQTIHPENDPQDPNWKPYSMTEEILIQRSQNVDRGRFFPQLYICFTLTLGMMSAGYTIGAAGPKIREQFEADEGEYNPERARFASIVALGCATGNIIMPIACFARGPRKVILIGSFCNVISWIIMPILNSWAWQKTCMFISAFLSVGYIPCGKILLMDAIHESYYYSFLLIFGSSYGFGIMSAYIIGFSTKVMVLDYCGAAIIFLFFVFLMFTPESAIYLYKSNPNKAEKALEFFRGKKNLSVLMRQIAKDNEARMLTVSTKIMFLHSVVYKGLIIIVTLSLFQCFYAYHLFLMYQITLWNEQVVDIDLDVFGMVEDGIILGVCFYVFPLIGKAFNLRMTWGLRKPIMAAAISVPILLVLHGLLLHYRIIIPHLGGWLWIVFILKGVYIFCVNISDTWALDQMISDYLPEQIQIWAIIVVFTAKYIGWSFIFWLTFMLENKLEPAGIIAIFTGVSLIGIPFCYYFIIESEGKTLQQIQVKLGGNPVGTRNSFRSRYQNYLTAVRRQREEMRNAGELLKRKHKNKDKVSITSV